MSTNQVLIGVGLIFLLAATSQVLAARLRIPSLIILLPAGFIAGAVTSDVNPVKLLGPAFEPAISVAVAVILYDAGLGLDLRKLPHHYRKVVSRLIILGLVFSFTLTVIVAPALLGMSGAAAVMLGAILVVTGPTVVGPLLDFVRPATKVQQVLIWEGSLMDPIGAIFGAAVFHAVSAGSGRHFGSGASNLLSGLGIGVVGAIAGVALLWLVLHVLDLPEVLGTNAQLAVVVAVAAICDVFRTDSGLIAAILMGLAVSNLRSFNISARRPFFETLVQLIIGLLFVSIAATITPSSLRGLVWPTIGLVAVLVVIARPLTAWLSTMRTDLTKGERAFVGWMAPRGIVAAATATTFTTDLVHKGVAGAAKILPVTFLVIVVTVALYGLTAKPVASRLGVLRSLRSRPLLVGGGQWVIDLARTLRSAGLDVLMWAGYQHQRELITQASLPLAQGELLAWTSGQAAELEGITAVYLLTDEDDFNSMASLLVHSGGGPPVYTLAPQTGNANAVAPSPAEQTLFADGLDRPAIDHRYDAGATIDSRRSDGTTSDGGDILFVIDLQGRLRPATQSAIPAPRTGDTVIVLAGDRRLPTSGRWRGLSRDPVLRLGAIARRGRAMAQASGSRRVVIVGGGFAGLFAARALRDAPVQVTLLDKAEHHLFQPLLYQYATGILSDGKIAVPLRELLKRHRNVEFTLAEVTGIDAANKRVLARRPLGEQLEFDYDYLILAAGVQQSYFGHDEYAEFAPGMKSIEDARRIRRRVFGAFEMAESADDPAERSRWLTFVLVGAGPTGVELAGQVRELATKTLSREYRHIQPKDARVLLFDGGKAPLAAFGPKLSALAASDLKNLGVELHMGCLVTEADLNGVQVKDHDGNLTRYEAGTILWTAGVQAPPLAAAVAQATGAQQDRAGRLLCGKDLSLPGHPDILVTGDLMCLNKLPGVAEVAMQSGLYAGRRITHESQGQTYDKPFKYYDLGSAAYISRGRAVISAGPLHFGGFPGWCGWLFIHIGFLTGFRNRFGALLSWWTAFVRDLRRERAFTIDDLPVSVYQDLAESAGRGKHAVPHQPASATDQPEEARQAQPPTL